MSEQATVDWRTLEAGESLDWHVAAREGYRVEKRKDGYWYLIRPNGTPKGNYVSKEEAQRGAPRYSTDANAALALLSDLPAYYFVDIQILWGTPQSIEVKLWSCEGVGDELIAGGDADTPALAIVRAWLAWKDAK